MSHPLYTNRLIHEKSPYLLQHAHNPVDWYPWGDEAFEAAREQDKPIFLSVGYATCHWCHVMEEESFEDEEVGKMMNETFINIKVDREEMPEIDSLYMEFAQAMMSGEAGWPLNLILTHELTPFFAATYLPSDATQGYLGLKQLVMRISQIWHDPMEREAVVMQAGKIVDIFASNVQMEGNELPRKELLKEAGEQLFKVTDPVYGGTKGAPKFPAGFQSGFMLRYVCATADSRALFFVEKTLDMMQRGGIYDHIGGGFSRYSVDEKWLVPHFEKMLYDNVILARTYLEAWEYSRHHKYREVAEQILRYVARDLRSPEGGFLSAEDADSEGREGRFYTWGFDEIQSVLGVDAPLFCEFYGVHPHGNFEGRSILHTPYSLEEFATYHKIDAAMLNALLVELRGQLFDARKQRVHPKKDDKVLASWNGLAIHAFAQAGSALCNPRHLDIAEQAAEFVHDKMWNEQQLLRRWREEDARFPGCLDDYAFMIQGVLSLFEGDRGTKWLEFAISLAQVLDRDFKADHGAYYLTDGQDPNLILRRSEFYDGAEPSGNAVHTENLLRLYQITGIDAYLDRAEDVLKAAKEHIEMYPPGACYHLMALQRYYDADAPTLVIALNDDEENRDEIAKMLGGYFIPHKAVIWRRSRDEELRDLLPITRSMVPQNGKTTLYICRKGSCQRPLTELPDMWKAVEKL